MLTELPPSSFRFGNYGAGIAFNTFIDKFRLLEWLKFQYIIGFSKTPEFKPLNGYTAILIEDGWEGWSHIPNEVFVLLQKSEAAGIRTSEK